MRGRVAQFYIFDALFAAFIFFIGITILASAGTSSVDKIQIHTYSIDALTVLTAQQVQDIVPLRDRSRYVYLRQDNTPAQQIQRWAHVSDCDGCADNATVLIQRVISAIPQEFSVNITLLNATNDPLFTYGRASLLEGDHSIRVVSRRMVVSLNETGGILGPDTIEVTVSS